MTIGFLGIAHLHADGYAHSLRKGHPEVSISAFDDDASRLSKFTSAHGAKVSRAAADLLATSDAIIVTSENRKHLGYLEACHAAGKPVLCEKPIVAAPEEEEALRRLIAEGAQIMTAFPCRYSPAYRRLAERVRAGEIGEIRAICATNRGRCPGGWFTDANLSGGGAMIDHVVHVADLLWVLLGEAPTEVFAAKNNLTNGFEVDDTAVLTLNYASGRFATLDSSWSRPEHYKTWGDVTMNVVGDNGVIELDMFGQQFDTYPATRGFAATGYGSDLDGLLLNDFLKFAVGEIECPITAEDGLRAVKVAWAGYASSGSSPHAQTV